jgi:type I restriction-modification system DNA methylase subunit
MNRTQARQFVTETFTHAFNKTRFHNFVLNVLNHLDESKAAQWNQQYVKDAFKDHVQKFERLGTFTSPDRQTVDVLIVHLTTDSKLERARTSIRNFVADHLKQRDEKDAALVAFVSPTESNWRFSYIRMEYATVQSDSGKVGVEARLTPARRFSYIVGEGESCHTAQSRFLNLLANDDADPSLAQIEEAFSVEAVTKEFFEKYAELFGSIHAALEKLAAKNKAVRDEFTAKGVQTVDFAKKLMGQIVFLYFLQKKGWLGVERGKPWGTGPHDLLRKMASGAYGEYKSFFNDILEPLFYDTLASDRGHEAWCDHFKCRIPFLNGGLFEPLGDYDWRGIDIPLANELFTNAKYIEEGVTGSGVLDVFDRYNFTVNEAEPLEKEVAIDPEMLGKVFENLIEENRRKGLGAYYTPREIVHYMCQESLVSYLDTSLNKVKQVIPRDDLETFVHLGEQYSFYEAAKRDGTVGKNYPSPPRSIQQHARFIDERLSEITVCDPAVGSGAFPVGMMSEVVRCRCALTPYFTDVHERTPYHFKRHAIQNCLYGVDIDAGAVEIAKLRLWLSLVVDEEEITLIKPLPNLSYKIVAGNSLLGVGKTLFNESLFTQLEELKPKYFDESATDKKAKLKKQIDQLIHQLTKGKETFDFDIYFSEVFHRNRGFDVMIANPPYVGESGHKELFRGTKEGPLGEFYLGKMDYFYFFLHLALNLARENGEVTFITTNYYLTATGASKLRADFKRRATIRQLVNFNELRIFESAQGQHNMLTLLNKTKGGALLARTCVTRRTGMATPETLLRILSGEDNETQYYEIPQDQLFDGPENYIRISREGGRDQITIDSILDKMASKSERLDRIANIDQGVVSGCDYVSSRNKDKLPKNTDAIDGDGIFVFDLENPRDLEVVARFTRPEKRLLRSFYKNSDIKRYWCSDQAAKRLLYINRELDCLDDYPNVAAHLRRFRPILSSRREAENGTIKYFQLQWPRTEEIFLSPKLVVPYRSEDNAFAYNETEWFCRSDCYVITEKNNGCSLKYLMALLNSKLYFQWLYHRGKRKGEMLEMFQIPLSEVPVLRVNNDIQKPFIALVDRILDAKRRNPAANVANQEDEINQLVYKLYGLTAAEIQLVEESTARRPRK